MSKLDDIIELNKEGWRLADTEAKDRFKDLILELLEVDHTSDNDDDLLDRIRQKVKEL
jgi:hypothetical protein